MRLQYNVLWFEDDFDLVDVDIGPEIKDYLKNLGFTLRIVHQENGFNLDKFIDGDFDLILTDLNLGEDQEAGDRLIEHIRSNKVLTEVLLYSGNEAGIKKIIETHGLIERVSFSVGTSNLKDKIMQIIDLSVKKVQDVNNLRGLMMAETSELDLKMLTILQVFLVKGSEEHQEQLRNYIFKITEESLKGNERKLLKYKDNNNAEELITWALFDSYKKNRTINKLLSIICNDELAVCSALYQEEIIDTRNILGHVVEKIDESGKVVLESTVPGCEPINFNNEMCVSIRKKIHKHSANLSEILKLFF